MSVWNNRGHDLDSHPDVDTTTTAPTDGQALVWDDANSEWVPGDAGSSSPLTTKGDLYTHDGTADARLAVGADGKWLKANSGETTGLEWADPPGAYAETIGDGSTTSFAVTHSLGTEDVHVQVWDVSGTDPVLANGDPSSVTATDTNTVTVSFGSAPTTDQYRVVVLASGASGGGGGGGTTWLDPVPSGNGPGGSFDDEFDDDTVDAAWTTVEDASPNVTLTESGDVLSVYNPGGDAAQEWHAIVKSMGALSAPVTITAAVRVWSQAQRFTMAGIGFSDGTTWGSGTQMEAGIFLDSNVNGRMNAHHRQWTGFDTYVAGGEDFSLSMFPPVSGWIFIRHTWVSSNTWRAEFSPDGESWINPGGGDHSVTMTPTHMGLWVSTYGGTAPMVATFEYFRVS